MARWSSGQDAGLSRRKQGFDSPTGHQLDLWSSGYRYTVSANADEVPPVPIPNTVVKLIWVENTWREAAWEDRSVLTPSKNARHLCGGCFY